MTRKSIRALGLAVGLVIWSFVPRRHPVVQATLGAAFVAAMKAPVGLRPPALWAGLRLGSAAASVVAAAVGTSTAIPRVRSSMAERTPPAAPAAWLALQIPVGTVWFEEAAYRGALATLSADAFGPRGRVVQAAAFGLSHIADARATGEPVIGTVVATGAAGWVFGWLAERSGSLAAPMLTHLAINEAGAIAALLLQRR
ncbi:MAG: CPBP family intramembrane glutamic endopeptidase [Candidatus Sericytochromatia bacterium]